ncbi:MAG: molybdopterin-dependent oxidoreductase, partial [Myxococcota bacterium]
SEASASLTRPGAGSRRSGFPPMLMQAPATLLADEILTPGEGQVRALINIGGNPLRRLPAPGRVKDALASLELLVHIGRVQDDGAALADWLLPATHPWERDDKTLHNAMQLPLTGVLGTPSVSTAPPEARTPAEILRALFTAVRPGLRGSVWGRHLGLFAQYLARADLAGWEARILEWAGDVSPEQLGSPPYRVIQGASDRATWRPSTPDERLDLLPNGIQAILQRIEPPVADAARPLFLRTSSRVDRAPDDLHRSAPLDACAFVHPDTGVKDGQPVSLETVYGAVQLIARHDERLRPDTVDASAARVPAILGLLNPDRLDPLTATPEMDGLNCALR